VACSNMIQNEYKNNRKNFLMNVMNDPYYIENISGIQELINEINLDEIDNDDF
jgi:hypothetical protein